MAMPNLAVVLAAHSNQNRSVGAQGSCVVQTTTLMALLAILIQLLMRMSEMEGKLERALGHEKSENVNQIQGNGNVIINGPVTINAAPAKTENRPTVIEVPREQRRFNISRNPHDNRILGSVAAESKPAFSDNAKGSISCAASALFAPFAAAVDLIGNAKLGVSGSAKVGPASGSFNFKFGE